MTLVLAFLAQYAIIYPMKSDPINDLLDDHSFRSYGRKRSVCIKQLICVSCGADVPSPGKWNKDIDEREYNISGLCGDCQDAIFSREED